MISKQIKQFYSFFPNGTLYKTALDSIVISDKLKHIKIHTSIWKFYLLIFPNFNSLCITQENWMPIIESKRNEFYQIQEKYRLPSHFESSLDSEGPLSKNEKSKWGQYHKDNELKSMISRDTNRLFQDIPFFHIKENIENINEIIFLHLRNFPEITYNQGFHEICGIIYFYFCQEMKVKAEINQSTETQDIESFDFIFSSDHVMADAFWVYSKIILYIYKYYEESKDTTIISKICYDILQIYMKRIDWDISQKLTEDSNLNIMMYQWFRILFGRVFQFNQINQIWSFIFSFFPEDKILSDMSISLILSKKKEIVRCTEQTEVIVIFNTMHSDHPQKIIKLILKLQQPKQKTVKNEDQKNNSISKYKQRQENNNKLRLALFEPICKETEKITPEICVKPKEIIIDQLKKLRDAFNVVSLITYPTSQEKDLFTEDGSQVELSIENENSTENVINEKNNDNNNEDTSNIKLNDLNVKILPKATSGKFNDIKADTSLLTREDEKVFKNKSDLFTKPTNPKNLFE